MASRHRWTGRYEAHLWDKSTWNQNQNKKGKQGCSRSLNKTSNMLLEQIWIIRFIKLTLCLLFVMSVEWFVEQSARPVYLGKQSCICA